MLVPAQPLLGSPYLLPYSAYQKHGKVAGVSPTDWAELSQLTNKKLVFSPLGADSKEDSLGLPPRYFNNPPGTDSTAPSFKRTWRGKMDPRG